MKNISIFEEKYGWINYKEKDYILTELMKPTGEIFPGDIIETSANAIDDDNNNYIVYWKVNKNDINNPDYDKVDRVER